MFGFNEQAGEKWRQGMEQFRQRTQAAPQNQFQLPPEAQQFGQHLRKFGQTLFGGPDNWQQRLQAWQDDPQGQMQQFLGRLGGMGSTPQPGASPAPAAPSAAPAQTKDLAGLFQNAVMPSSGGASYGPGAIGFAARQRTIR